MCPPPKDFSRKPLGWDMSPLIEARLSCLGGRSSSESHHQCFPESWALWPWNGYLFLVVCRAAFSSAWPNAATVGFPVWCGPHQRGARKEVSWILIHHPAGLIRFGGPGSSFCFPFPFLGAFDSALQENLIRPIQKCTGQCSPLQPFSPRPCSACTL
jgi:hypothetical protein